MIASAKPSVDEQSIRYQALTKITGLAEDIASVRNLNSSNQKILQATKIRLWLKALDYKNYLSREQREKIWYALIDISGIYDFPVAPVLANVNRPDILIGGGGGGAGSVNEWGDIGGVLSNQTDLQAALDAKVDISGDTMTGNLGFTGAGINPTDYIQFNTVPTSYTPAIGNIGWNDVEGTIDLLLRGGVVNLPLGQKQVARIVNGTGGNVLKSNYQVVKVIGAQGQRLQVALAQANNDANSADTLGLIAENINNNNTGFIVTSGLVENINTTGSLQGETWVDGNILYLSPTVAGRITNVKPQAPQHTVIVGFVVYAHANNGKIYVKVDNGYEIDELHNVRITTPTNGQVLKYNSTLSVWENNTVSDGHTIQDAGVNETQRTNLNFQRMLVTDDAGNNATVVTRPSDTFIGITAPANPVEGDEWTNSETWSTYKYYDGFWVEISNINPSAVAGTGTTNYLPKFTGASTIGNSLVYDNGTSVAIGTASPSYKFQVSGTSGTVGISASSNTADDILFYGVGTVTGNINLLTTNINATSTSLLVNRNYNSATGNAQIEANVPSTSTGDPYFLLTTSGATNWSLGIDNSASDIFKIGPNANPSSGSASLSITTGGNTLIGTTTDSGFKLDVNGLVNFTGTTASDGGQLGAELLSASGWTSTGWTGSFGAGWTHTVGNTTALTNTLAAVNGNYYQITYTVTGRTAGSFTLSFGGYSIAGITATGNTGPQAISTGTLSITPTTDFDGTIVISIKVITAGSANLTIKNSAGTVINEINGSSSNTNIFVGLDAGSRNTTGLNNTFLGSSSGLNNTNGTDNSFFGYISGQSNTVGSNNTFLGSFAGWSNTIGGFNTFVGSSGRANTTGNFNCYFGARAGISSTTTSGNCFFGYEAGRQTTGSTNSFYGYQSGTLTTSGSNNVGFGLFSGLNNTTGSNNSFFGSESGRRISSGANLTVSNNSVFLGYDTRANADSETNQLVVGYAAIGLGSNTTVLGNSSTTYGRWYGNLLVGSNTNSGEALQITGLSSFTGTTASDGGQLGAELLSASGWTSTDWTGSFATGWTHTTGNTTALTNTLAAVNGNYYQITYTVTGRTAGTFVIAFGGYTSGSLSATGNVGPRATSTGTLSITPTTDFDGTIVLSIKVITAGSATLTIKNSSGTVINEINGSSSNTNTFIGVDAGSRITTGIYNTFSGSSCGLNNTVGSGNSFYGNISGISNTIGAGNSFFGWNSGANNITGSYNSFFGWNSGYTNNASNNAFFGREAGYNSNGDGNSYFGIQCAFNATTGTGNSIFGREAAKNNTTGSNNVAVGLSAGRFISSGANLTIANNSVFLGYDTRANADSETNQLVVGYAAIGLGSNTTVIGNSSTTYGRWWGNLLVGTSTNSGNALHVKGTIRLEESSSTGTADLYSQNSNLNGQTITRFRVDNQININNRYVTSQISNSHRLVISHPNIAGATSALLFGVDSIQNDIGIVCDRDTSNLYLVNGSNTNSNTYTPRQTIFSNGNIAIGTTTDSGYKLDVNGTARVISDALINGHTIGRGLNSISTNLAVGFAVFGAITTGDRNTSVGANSAQVISSGQRNTSIGAESLIKLTTGSYNTGIGFGALYEMTTSSNNTALGYVAGRFINAGTNNTTSNNSIFIGYDTRSSADGNTNEIIIGYNGRGNGSNTITIGNTSTANNYIFGNFNVTDANNIIFGTTTGTKIGTATTQKIGFFNATPVVQPSAVTTAQGIADALSSLGLLASSSISTTPDVGGKLYLFNSY